MPSFVPVSRMAAANDEGRDLPFFAVGSQERFVGARGGHGRRSLDVDSRLLQSVPLLGTSSVGATGYARHCLCQAVAHRAEKCGLVVLQVPFFFGGAAAAIVGNELPEIISAAQAHGIGRQGGRSPRPWEARGEGLIAVTLAGNRSASLANPGPVTTPPGRSRASQASAESNSCGPSGSKRPSGCRAKDCTTTSPRWASITTDNSATVVAGRRRRRSLPGC